jgi:DNA-binding MarR family transcriptional regulator
MVLNLKVNQPEMVRKAQGRASVMADNQLDLSNDWTMFASSEDAPSSKRGASEMRLELLGLARAEAKRRADRRELFGAYDVLSDPAWDILLELYIAGLSGSGLYASVVGTEAGIPQSTALRWLTVLEKSGLVRRHLDQFDKRRQWVGVTPRARGLMEKHFARSLQVLP